MEHDSGKFAFLKRDHSDAMASWLYVINRLRRLAAEPRYYESGTCRPASLQSGILVEKLY